MINNRRPLYLTLIATLTAGPHVHAAEWVAAPSVSLRGEYRDNIRLTTAPHDSVWGAILEPGLKLSRRSELWDSSLNARLRAEQYPDDDSLDTLDNFFDAATKRRFQRGSFEASAGLTNDTSLQNEFLDFDTGVTVSQIDRTQKRARLAGDYLLTETTSLKASVDYLAMEYDQNEQHGLLDYDYLTPALSLVHQYDPKTQFSLLYSYSEVDYDTPTDLESKTHSLMLGASYDITERWNVSGSVGSRRTETSAVVEQLVAPTPGLEFLCGFLFPCDTILVPRDSESTGIVYDARLTREFETGSLYLNGSRSISPSSTGTDTETTTLTLHGTRSFSAKLSAQLTAQYFQSSTVGGVRTRADIDRYRIAPSMDWRLDEELTLKAGYAYTRIERDTATDNTADDNLVFVSLHYTWPRWAVSR